MSEAELAFANATDMLARFRTRQLSPVEVLESLVNRARLVEPKINAFASQRIEQASEQAKYAERVYRDDPFRARPLEGVPVALKNEHTLVGDSTTIGSSLLRGVVDSANAPITQRLLDAGAIIHAKTNVPEFCCAGLTCSKEYGATRSPWNLAMNSGGSSGGSAAALAAGTTTLATGSDIGGSIRIPASFCGVVGLKPSYGRIPEAVYEIAMNTYNHNGPLARTVADCALMFNVINGAHRDDPATVTPRVTVSGAPILVDNLSVALSMDLGYFSVDPEIVRNTEAVSECLRRLGARVDDVRLEWNAGTRQAAADALIFAVGRPLARTIAGRRDLVNDYTIRIADAGMKVTPEQYLDSFVVMGAMDRALQDVFDTYDVLVCPTMAITGVAAEGPYDAVEDVYVSAMTYPFNMLSRHPVLSIPSGFARNGMPTGVQIVGRRFEDERVLQVGAAIERELQWTRFQPPL